MRKAIFLLSALFFTGKAQDSISTAVTDNKESSSLSVSMEPLGKLHEDDYKKFYIGFTSKENFLEVITLDINQTDTADSSITFHYTLNTKDKREVGVGEIMPTKSRIRFQNMEEGYISLPQDGKIEFESVTQDSLNYWKLKEK